jgi:hypothetical protein
MGETVNVAFAPMRYTGQMQDFAQRLSDEDETEVEAIAELRAQAADEIERAGKNPKALALAQARASELNGKAAEREQRMDLRNRKALRDSLAADGDGKGGPPGLLVAWDVMEGRKRLGVDRATLDRLPDLFLRVVFLSLARENQPDPPKAPNSDEP